VAASLLAWRQRGVISCEINDNENDSAVVLAAGCVKSISKKWRNNLSENDSAKSSWLFGWLAVSNVASAAEANENMAARKRLQLASANGGYQWRRIWLAGWP